MASIWVGRALKGGTRKTERILLGGKQCLVCLYITHRPFLPRFPSLFSWGKIHATDCDEDCPKSNSCFYSLRASAWPILRGQSLDWEILKETMTSEIKKGAGLTANWANFHTQRHPGALCLVDRLQVISQCLTNAQTTAIPTFLPFTLKLLIPIGRSFSMGLGVHSDATHQDCPRCPMGGRGMLSSKYKQVWGFTFTSTPWMRPVRRFPELSEWWLQPHRGPDPGVKTKK